MATTMKRDRYIDVLRAAALVRVITFHSVGWVWLPLLFPSMGIMFALAGSLAAASLDRAGSVAAFLRKRLRRLLIPFWAFAAIMLATMMALGWGVSADDGSTPLTWQTAWLWVLPLADPPASSQGYEWTMILWYVRTYLWFLLLTPAMLWLFRRWPLRLMAFPVVTVLLVSAGLVTITGGTYWIVLDVCVYAGCWMLGFAHHDGALSRLPKGRTLAGGAVLMAVGGWLVWSHQVEYGPTALGDIPMADMLYSLGAVLILLRLYPRSGRFPRLPGFDAVVGLINSRALTVYLWGNVAIALSPVVVDLVGLGSYNTGDAQGDWLRYGTTWTLLFVAVLALGWVEDVAAQRRPRLLRWGASVAVPPADAPAAVTAVDLVPALSGASVPAPRSEAAPRGGTGALVERVVLYADNVVRDEPSKADDVPRAPEPAVMSNDLLWR